jgi:hypothetical protein
MALADDLVAFLRVRLDEDEQTAYGLINAAKFIDAQPTFYGVGGPAAHAHWERFGPARVLVEVAAKRDLLDEVLDWGHGHAFNGEGCPVDPCLCDRDERVRAVLERLVPPYREHPDYRQEWAS